jgi:CubicO group peptidase (beta-lactamase class C family)
MHARRALFIACVAVTLIASTASAQRVFTVTGEEVPSMTEFDEIMRGHLEENDIDGAALAVTLEGRLIFAHGYTWAEPGAEIITPTHLFRIASMSKPITSVAVHQLIERGLLSYDTPVADTLGLVAPPGTEPDPNLDRVILDHLLYHSGGWDRGLSYDPMDYDETIASRLGVELPITKYDIAHFMTGEPLQHGPGTRSVYCNYGFSLLGLLIEHATGRDYTEWVRENVFAPIEVSRPRRGHSVRDELVPTEAVYRSAWGDPYRYNIENVDAAGGWIMSAPDYVRFLSSLFDPEESVLLSRESIDDMLTPWIEGHGYARGWEVAHDPVTGFDQYSHGGGLPGTLTQGVWISAGLAGVLLLSSDVDGPYQGPDFDEAMENIADWPDHDLFPSVGIDDHAPGMVPAESWVAAVAHVDGAEDSVWRTDVGLLNRSSLASRLRLRLSAETDVEDLEFELAPGELRTVEDVVAAMGTTGNGALRVFASEPVMVSSRTFSAGGRGTFGQYLGGVATPDGLRTGESAVLMQLQEDTTARSNIGLLNGGRRAARVRVELYEGSGYQIATKTRKAPAGGRIQLDRPLRLFGRKSHIPDGYAVVTVLDGVEVVAYGSVIDNTTNDPTTILMKTVAATDQWVAAAAHVGGEFGSEWRTDLGLLNRSGGGALVNISFTTEGGDTVSDEVTLADGEQIVLEDVLTQLGVEGSGSIRVTSDRPVLVTSRTYSIGDGGSYGQSLDGYGSVDTVARGERVWLTQLQQNELFRSNIGVVNTGSDEATVTITMFDHDGTELASRRRRIEQGGRIQLQEPFLRIADRADLTAGYASVTVQAGKGIIVYGSVIDNATNDPTTIPMHR